MLCIRFWAIAKAMTRPFSNMKQWPFARLELASFYVYGLQRARMVHSPSQATWSLWLHFEISFLEVAVHWPRKNGGYEWTYASSNPGDMFGVGSEVVGGYYMNFANYDYCHCQFVVTVELEGKPGGCRRGRSQPHSSGWARVPLSSFFPQILINLSYFSSNFTLFLPHFGSPGGRLDHPGRPWLRHWVPIGICFDTVVAPEFFFGGGQKVKKKYHYHYHFMLKLSKLISL